MLKLIQRSVLLLFLLLITSTGFAQILPETKDLSKEDFLQIFSASKIIWAVIVLVVGYFITKGTTKLLRVLAERSTTNRITLKGFIPVVRIISWTLIILFVIMGIFKPPVSTVLALSASAGVAIGFAAQDILKNIFGGIVVITDRPFSVGDKIEVGDYYGEVQQIGLRSTRIVTPDDSLVSIPNSEIMNSSVSNSNAGEANCQVVAEIFLPITINTKEVREIAIKAAQVSKYIYLKKPIVALFFNEMNENKSYYKMRLKAYVMDIRQEFAFKSEMTELVIQALVEKGILKDS